MVAKDFVSFLNMDVQCIPQENILSSDDAISFLSSSNFKSHFKSTHPSDPVNGFVKRRLTYASL